ncbi:MAG: MBL fold metallo-hydrolase [Mailhella sp.]|nr:MBL fold metallo-hydrolase [Mailhella sp.]
MPVFSFSHGKYSANTCLVWQGKDAVLIDPPHEEEALLEVIEREDLTIHALLCTHLHIDHVMGCGVWQKRTGLPILAMAEEIAAAPAMLARAAQGGNVADEFRTEAFAPGLHTWGELRCDALFVPGHTPGSLCFYFPDMGVLISGDSLYKAKPALTHFPESIPEALLPALQEKIFTLPHDTIVYPGHGTTTNIGDEACTADPFPATINN